MYIFRYLYFYVFIFIYLLIYIFLNLLMYLFIHIYIYIHLFSRMSINLVYHFSFVVTGRHPAGSSVGTLDWARRQERIVAIAVGTNPCAEIVAIRGPLHVPRQVRPPVGARPRRCPGSQSLNSLNFNKRIINTKRKNIHL